MNIKQQHELDFWARLILSEGTKYLFRREGDYQRHTSNYDGKIDLRGIGAEFGVGCYSCLEWCPAEYVVGVDPLADEYDKILPIKNTKVRIINEDGENASTLDDNFFDWVVCWNTIDHTPDPFAMASEMLRVLKPMGYLYLEVNFDDELATPHYSIWNKEKVDYCLQDFQKVWEKEVRNDADRQTNYYAIFQKP